MTSTWDERSMSMLSLDDCHVSYGAVQALRGVTVHVAAREAVGIVGPLTAGKTTLLRVAAGMVTPDRGDVTFEGRSLRGVAADARARAGIVHVPADGGIFPSLTVHENLLLAQPSSAGTAAAAYVTELFPVLGERLR